MENQATTQYNKSLMTSRLFPRDPLFWRMLATERFMYSAHKGSHEAMNHIHMHLRRVFVELYRKAYLAGYDRIRYETELADEVTKDMNNILDDNCFTSGKTWLLWRLINDEDDFHAVARKVCEEHEASLRYK